MDELLQVGIQGKGSASVKDIGILADLLLQQTGIEMKMVPEDNILLKLEWLKNGRIDFM